MGRASAGRPTGGFLVRECREREARGAQNGGESTATATRACRSIRFSTASTVCCVDLRSERAGVAATAAHEGGHVESFLSGRAESIVQEEIRAFGHQVDFQRATGQTPLFQSSRELEAYVKRYYSE